MNTKQQKKRVTDGVMKFFDQVFENMIGLQIKIKKKDQLIKAVCHNGGWRG